MRASKVPGAGISLDVHSATPPSLPPVPPSPVNPALVPAQPWVQFIVNPLMGLVVTGKWSHQSVATEGQATILWQHDWGPLQPHKIIPAPVIKTPSTLLLLIGSSAKYYLPSFSVKQRLDGAVGSGSAPVAICFPAYCIVMQTCADIATKSFYLPLPGVCLQNMTTRWVGFSGGDLLAGLIGVAGDSLAALVLSHFGGKLFAGFSDNLLFGGLGGSAANVAGGTVVGPMYAMMAILGVAFFGAMHGEGEIRPGTFQGIAGILLAPVISWAGGQAATGVGDTSGSKPSDADPSWEQDPRPAAPAPAPPSHDPPPGDAGADSSPADAGPPSSTADAGAPASSAPDTPPTDPPVSEPSSSSADESGGTSSADNASGGVCEPPPAWL